ncbi:hypothetical protein ACJ72_07379 [Emergomyces africanus]|uniref:Aminoglycoside phosphotransferase domain-containing protein n=1 Tax=Emergomyces africanus TaxID=1955775 RepID=A0A1B7NNB6_9EURO|nr:hypothetical protein ACJ72_07379 [Emergomyces africanus]
MKPMGVKGFEGAYLTATDTIYSAKLTAIEHLSLTNFLVNSYTPAVAGQYVHDRISQNPDCTLEETLRSIWKDLKTLVTKCGDDYHVPEKVQAALTERDGPQCCITGSQDNVKPTYIVSPYILHDPDFEEGAPLRLLLEAVITKEGVEELFAFLGSSSVEDQLKNLWLMGPSARIAFRCGQIYISKAAIIESTNGIRSTRRKDGGWRVEVNEPQEYPVGKDVSAFYKVPSTKDPKSHPLPAALLLDFHRRIFVNLYMHIVERGVQRPWAPLKQGWAIGSVGIFFLRNFLSILPKFVRLALYNFIDRQIDSRDPKQRDQPVKFLPLGLCLKRGRRYTKNEANSLRLVEKESSINAPKLIDHVRINESSGFVLMTQVYGHPLNRVLYRTTYEEREQIAKDLAQWIMELRKIPNKSKYLIANAYGGPICDHMYEGRTPGPLNSTAEFADDLTQFLFHPEQHKHQPPIEMLYEKKYDVCFTHSDLHMTNIIVRDGRLFGLIDWENSGFKPEYWEYVRALWPSGHKRGTDIYRQAFGDKYEDEFEALVCILQNSPIVLGW